MSMTEGTSRGEGGDHRVNIGSTERALTALAGGLMVGWGLRHGRAGGTLAAFFGSMMLGRSITGHCPGYAMMEHGDESRKFADRKGWSSASTVMRSITIERPRDEIHAFWRDFSNLARFMDGIESIEVLSPDRSRWTVKGPTGTSLHWISKVTEDRPDRIAWETEGDADVRNAGWVEFKELPGGRRTEVRTMIAYEPPAGVLGKTVATLFGREPGRQVATDLENLKRLLERGNGSTGTPMPGSAGSGRSGGDASGGAFAYQAGKEAGTTDLGSEDRSGGRAENDAGKGPGGGSASRAGKPGVTGKDVDR